MVTAAGEGEPFQVGRLGDVATPMGDENINNVVLGRTTLLMVLVVVFVTPHNLTEPSQKLSCVDRGRERERDSGIVDVEWSGVSRERESWATSI